MLDHIVYSNDPEIALVFQSEKFLFEKFVLKSNRNILNFPFNLSNKLIINVCENS